MILLLYCFGWLFSQQLTNLHQSPAKDSQSCLVSHISSSCLVSHSNPCLMRPMRDWFGGSIFTDNSSRQGGICVLPDTLHAPRTVPSLTVCWGQIWICRLLISKHTHKKKKEKKGDKSRRWRTGWLFRSLAAILWCQKPQQQTRRLNWLQFNKTKNTRFYRTP